MWRAAYPSDPAVSLGYFSAPHVSTKSTVRAGWSAARAPRALLARPSVDERPKRPLTKRSADSASALMKRSADSTGMGVEGGAAKMHFRLLLPNKQTGTVIGKGGANIKSIREASGCQVQISENVQGATDRLITIIGDSSVINTAVARLLAIIDEDPQASMIVDTSTPERTLRCVLNNNEAGRIIGKGGATIKQIRTESGAQLRMDPESGADRIVALVGSRPAIVEALTLTLTLTQP